MKKRSIKQLQLNKKSISTFKQEKVQGGTDPAITGVIAATATWLISEFICE